ncbi:MAG: hypothetical protein CVU86_02625 [Firmicutes bacterium HGW-Firmicutes-11]|jgi:lysophospholipase L1-like esterase|nr:MAG: hypothetical protein CVU86_02625 [Firmicutes bacterium HGW-Firmicutes-11]
MSQRKEKIVFIGNSIVNGFPHKRSECFVSRFREMTGHDVINKGINGETTDQIKSRFEKDVLSHKPSRVYLLTGTNDFIYSTATPAEALASLLVLGHTAIAHGILPVLLTPLMIDGALAEQRWLEGTDYEKVAKELVLMRELMMELSSDQGIAVVDTQRYYMDLYDRSNVEEYLSDGLHPTVVGHAALAEFLFEDFRRRGGL